ncbi:WRKY transcription factor 51 [Spatholobus suberectus]|nr:WRKY transcription factor 51 [Spatholobus suberectus]
MYWWHALVLEVIIGQSLLVLAISFITDASITTMDYYFGNPNPNPYYRHSAVANMESPSSEFMLSDYLMLEDAVDHQESWSQSTETESSEKATSSDASHGFGDATSTTTTNIKCENNGIKRKKAEVAQRITFRTRSHLEVMDDGYKWRKYGKKSVKNSPNPRNYYKCSGEGCYVKKRVERDRDDSNYVLTTYEGVHNHESPCTAYYSQMSLVHSNNWALQPSANSSSM